MAPVPSNGGEALVALVAEEGCLLSIVVRGTQQSRKHMVDLSLREVVPALVQALVLIVAPGAATMHVGYL
eukprot:1623059-Pyramimonas_sp.AAC.1